MTFSSLKCEILRGIIVLGLDMFGMRVLGITASLMEPPMASRVLCAFAVVSMV